MNLKSTLLRVFNHLARLVGVIWVLGGLLVIVGAAIDAERRYTYLVTGSFFLVAGIALIVVRRATPADFEW